MHIKTLAPALQNQHRKAWHSSYKGIRLHRGVGVSHKVWVKNPRRSINRELPIGSRGLLPDVTPVTSFLAVDRLELHRGSGPHARVFTVVTKRVNGQKLLFRAFGATTFNLPHHMHDERLPRGGVSIAMPASRLQCQFLHHDR